MATNVYTLHVAYEGLENSLWRDIEVSGNIYLNQLGYIVLATFDTMACHLFEFKIGDEQYQIPDEEFTDEDLDMAVARLSQFRLNTSDTFTMDYDFGTTQTFLFTVAGIRPMEKGNGKAYPKITAGQGCGIIDDMSATELRVLIAQIEENGKTTEGVYYKERSFPWDFHRYDIEIDNKLLKGKIAMINEAYEPFWDEYYEE